MPQELAILPWNTCTARCDHCGPSSGPSDNTHISHAKVLSLINEAGTNYEKPWYLSLSGGEIFLHYDRLLEYCKTAYSHGGTTAVITNCFWASSLEKALIMLEPLVENGLSLLGISFDKFHEPFISAEYVGNAIQAAQNLRLSVQVRSVATKSNRLWKILEQLSSNFHWYVDFIEIPCVPAGRAINRVPKDELLYMNNYPKGECPGASLTINPKGDGMICCNGASEIEGMNVGNIQDYSLAQLEQNFRTSFLVKYLLAEGPAGAVNFLSAHEKKTLEEKPYVSVCHLCHEIFKDPGRRKRIMSGIQEFYFEKLKKNMPSLQRELDRQTHEELKDG